MAPKISVVLCHNSSWPAFHIFNPNDWSGKSKPIIELCAANFGLLIYTSKLINDIFREAEALCAPNFVNLKSKWRISKWEIPKCTYLVDVPNLHLSIHSFLSAVKTYLDVLVQLTSTEGIVSVEVHGFHKKGKTIGGKLLHILKNNATKSKQNTAMLLYDLIIDHKRIWIDNSVNSRDLLIHPEGLVKMMFILVISEKDDELNLDRILKPALNGEEFDIYAKKTLLKIEEFTNLFLRHIKNA
jgi:hypothetical protein